jgi:hypothetical protein
MWSISEYPFFVTHFRYNLRMPNFRYRSSKGSALLLIIVLSGFMLVSFIAFSWVVRQSLKTQSTDFTDRMIQLDQFRDQFAVTGTGTLPNGYFLDPSWPIRYGGLTVFSGSIQTVEWTKSGTITLTRTAWAPFCYGGSDGAVYQEDCSDDTSSITLLAATGTLSIWTLGGFSGVSFSPASSVISENIALKIFRQVGNTVFLERILAP